VQLFFFFWQNPNEDSWKDPALEKLNSFCEESRNVNDWVPTVTLPEWWWPSALGRLKPFVAFSMWHGFTEVCNKLLIPWICLVKRLD